MPSLDIESYLIYKVICGYRILRFVHLFLKYPTQAANIKLMVVEENTDILEGSAVSIIFQHESS